MYRPDRLSPPLESVGEVEPQVCTLEHLIGWLETKPADEIYCWADGGRCLFGQYAKVHGLHYCEAVNKFGYFSESAGDFIEPHSIAIDCPRTFGAALSRAREALSRS
jgi:hypothetical protein